MNKEIVLDLRLIYLSVGDKQFGHAMVLRVVLCIPPAPHRAVWHYFWMN